MRSSFIHIECLYEKVYCLFKLQYNLMGFKNIHFGVAEAETEKNEYPRLLIEGFLDAHGYIQEIIGSNKFLVLGPKGSGKSAIGSKLELEAKRRDDLFVKLNYLEGFPYNAFKELIPSNEAPEIKDPVGWEYLFLIELIDSFSKDPTHQCTSEVNFAKVVDALGNLGLLPSENLTRLVSISTDKRFGVGIRDVLSGVLSSKKESIPFDKQMLFRTLQEVCYSSNTKPKHIVIIDGLDDVSTKRERQYQSLAALIIAADRMNKKLKGNGVNAKLVVLCRTDLFDRLKNPNKNKIKQVSTIILDWYQDVKDINSTNLVKLVNLRAEISLGRDVDVFREFFPEKIQGNKQLIKVLFENTRHIPRDLIQLLNIIQEQTKGNQPTQADIWNGIRKYSIDYFVSEIDDTLTGFMTPEDIENSFLLLALMGKNKFHINEVEKKCKNDARFEDFNYSKALDILYNCSAIGNYNRNKSYYTWKYWNPYSQIDPNQHIVVHKGLMKGLNIKYHHLAPKSNDMW